ncbi:MAG: PEP/pyruvate-binding domain-containing protein, partial [Anaerolineales bacterium]|nr:PEP/pyruvate-binding domain-containing protein [Anaerolineales bacterium]
MILPLNTKNARLDNVGGKAANLSRLARAGFSVPDGFFVTTQAYHDYLQANYLEDRIQSRLENIRADNPTSLQKASDEIRGWFSEGDLSFELVTDLKQAYSGIKEAPVAVRSSATAEDLPEMSFAGQHDTYLNIIGEGALLKAVVDCWSSLWTARAIGYRARNGIDHADVALSVVVQEMVQASASGVLFTANPLTGARTETVIDATFGLGEALVGGYVEPDHYIIDIEGGEITSKTLGSKALTIIG